MSECWEWFVEMCERGQVFGKRDGWGQGPSVGIDPEGESVLVGDYGGVM